MLGIEGFSNNLIERIEPNYLLLTRQATCYHS